MPTSSLGSVRVARWGRAEVLEASLHLGPGPGARTRVVLKAPPDRQQPQRPMYSHLVSSSRISF